MIIIVNVVFYILTCDILIHKRANRMKHMYDTDGIYNLKEQHDSYVWDYVRKEFENRGTKNTI